MTALEKEIESVNWEEEMEQTLDELLWEAEVLENSLERIRAHYAAKLSL